MEYARSASESMKGSGLRIVRVVPLVACVEKAGMHQSITNLQSGVRILLGELGKIGVHDIEASHGRDMIGESDRCIVERLIRRVVVGQWCCRGDIDT